MGQDIYAVENLDITNGLIDNLTCYRFTSGRLTQIVRVEKARWNGATWETKGVKTITFSDSGIITAADPSAFPLSKKPEDLYMARTNTEMLGLLELREYIIQLEKNGTPSPSAETEYLNRISFAFAPFVMTLLVIPFGMRFPRAGGIAKGISLGLMLGLSYWFLHSGMSKMGSSGMIDPLIASWGANITAVIVAAVIIFLKRRTVYG